MRAARRKKSRQLRHRVVTLAVAAALGIEVAGAAPTGAVVVNGQVGFSQQGKTLSITNTPGAIINWRSFSIAKDETTRFIQQSASSAVLNRVTGADPSQILGSLQSNGRVFLINPNGILFGAGAQIDTAGLVASSLNLSNQDFLAGRLRFTDTPGAGSVRNQGEIRASGGPVYLIAPSVENSGIIKTEGGDIILAAGRTVQLVDPKSPDVRIEMTAPENQAVNVGQLIANRGHVGIYAGMVRNSGTIRATGASLNEKGEVVLVAKKDVTLEKSSVVSASGPTGGNVTIQAQEGAATIGGTVEANATQGNGGTITISASQSLSVEIGGGVAANGITGGGSVKLKSTTSNVAIAAPVTANTLLGRAGDIAINAARSVTLAAGAVLSASGGQGRGTVLIGGSEGVKLGAGSIVQTTGDAGGAIAVQSDQGAVLVEGTVDASGVQADGGSVQISAQSDITLDVTGQLLARGRAGGEMRMESSEGTLLVSGLIDGRGTNGPGGAVYLLAPRVALLRRALVDVSGDTGGGTILVGGDYQGKNSNIQNALRTYVGNETSLRADAITDGDGGKIIVWSDDVTRVYGTLSARGGGAGGSGGFIETSGKNYLDVAGATVSASSLHGANGQWLLDPSDVTVVHGSTGTLGGGIFDPGSSSSIGDTEINLALNGGTDVTIQTSAGSGGTGVIIVNGAVDGGGAVVISHITGGTRGLTLTTAGTINVHSGASISGSAGNALNVTLSATGGNTIAGTIDNRGGTTTLTGTTTLSGTIKSGTLVTGSNLTSSNGTLDGVTIGTNLTLGGASNVLKVANDLVLANGVTVNVGNNQLGFATTGAQHLATLGTSAVTVAGGNITAGYGVTGQTLNIDAGVTVQGYGTLGQSSAATIVNAGALTANTAAQTFTINPTTFSNTGTGVLSVSAGTMTVSPTSWTNSGNVQVTGGVLNLGGNFATAGWNTFTHSAGAVNVTGVLTNAGTLDIGSAGLFGAQGLTTLSGTIIGGTVITSGGINLTSSNGTLDGVTIGSNLTFGGTSNVIRIANDLTLSNGVVVNVGSNLLGFVTTGAHHLATLGNSTINLATGNITAGYGVTGQTLNIDAGVTVQGYGSVNQSSTAAIVNAGSIIGNTGGQTLTINPDSFTNSGTLSVTAGTVTLTPTTFSNTGNVSLSAGTLNITPNGGTVPNWTNSGTITETGGTLNLGGKFTTADLAGSHLTRSSGALNLTSSLDNTGNTLDIGAGGIFDTGGLGTFTGTISGGTVISGDGTNLNSINGTLDGVTIGSILTFGGTSNVIRISNDLTLGNGVVVNLGSNFFGFVTTGTRHLATLGSSTVNLATGSITAGYTVAGQTLNIDAGITVQGYGAVNQSSTAAIVNAGSIIGNTGGQTLAINPDSFTNSGTVSVTAGTVTVNPTTTFTNTANVTVSAGTLNITPSGGAAPNWTNSGTITETGGTLNLGGKFGPASLAGSHLTRSGGVLNLTGTFDNTSNTLDIGAAGLFDTGGLSGLTGTISGGTLISGDGTNLNSTNGTLDGVTIGSNLTFGGVSNVTRISNDLTLGNGVVVNMGSNLLGFVTTGTRHLATLGSSTVNLATGSITAGYTVAGQTLNIDAGVTVQGYGAVNQSSSAAIVNAGSIIGNTGGQTLTINPNTFTNTGTLRANAGTVSTNGSFSSNAGIIDIAAGSILTTNNTSLTNASTGIIRGSGTLNVGSGTLTNNGLLQPGGSSAVGTLSITGALALGASSVLEIELNGTSGGTYDKLAVSGGINFTAGNTLNLVKLAGYNPALNDNFTNVVTYASRSGTNTFTNINPSFTGTFTPTYAGTNLSIQLTALGAVNTWIGLIDSNWETPGNWSLLHVPTNLEDAFLSLAGTVFLNSAQTVHSVASSEPINIVGGASLDLVTASAFGANLTVSGTLQGSGAITYTSGTLNWTGGTIKGSGLFTASGGLLTLGNSTLDGRTFNNSLNATLTGGNFSLANGAIFNHNAGAFSITDNSGLTQGAGAAGQFNNAGTFGKTGGGGTSLISGIGFANTGVVNAANGTLQFNNAVTGTGAFNVSSVLQFNAAATTGTLNLSSGNVTGSGDITVTSVFLQSGGTINTSGNLSLTQASGTLSIANGISAAGVTLNASAGDINVQDATVAGTGAMNVTASGNLNVTANTLSTSLNSTGLQSITAKSIAVTANGSSNAAVTSTGAGGQSIVVNNLNSGGGLDVQSNGAGSAQINSTSGAGNQSITVNDADHVAVIGAGGFAGISSAGNQTVLVQGAASNNKITIGSAASIGSSQISNSGNVQSVTAGTGAQAGSITIVGGVTDNLSARISSGNTGTGIQTISTSGTLTMIGGTAPTTGSQAQIFASASAGQAVAQSITANAISMTGGASGTLNRADLSTSSTVSTATQNITVGTGGISLTGGGGTNNTAQIRQNSANATAQTITVNAGGAIVLTGGTGIAGNAATITAAGGSQTVLGSPNLTLSAGASGGSTGNGNGANIIANIGAQNFTLGTTQFFGTAGAIDSSALIQAQNQNIVVNGDLTMNGATGGSGNNGTRIGSPTDTAVNLALTVHGNLSMLAHVGSAVLGINGNSTIAQAANITVNVDGNVVLSAGTGSTARIGQNLAASGGGNISVTAGLAGSGDITLTGTSANQAQIVTSTSGVAGNIALNATNITVQDSRVVADGTISATATNNLGVIANANAALIQSSGAQTIIAKGITVQGASSGNSLSAQITSGGGQNFTVGANGMTLTGGAGGAGNNANINQNGLTSDQLITVNGGGIVAVTGGGGTTTQAEIINSGMAQTLTFVAGGELRLQGGSGASGNEAGVHNNGVNATTQTIAFPAGGVITLTGGTTGTSNNAGIFAGGNQTISGTADITITGGASGGTAVADNGAYIALETGTGVQTVSAHNISLAGGAGGNTNAAAIGTNVSGMSAAITASGSVTLAGGAGTDAFAVVGSLDGDVNLIINATGPVNLTGGNGAFGSYGAFAKIGAASGFNANVTLNSNANIQLASGGGVSAVAAIGSDSGGGNVTVNAGVAGTGSLLLTGNATNRAAVQTTGNVTLTATNDIVLQDAKIDIDGILNVSATNSLSVSAVANNSRLASIGAQTITAKGITVQAGASGTNNFARIGGVNGQNITAGVNGITVAGGAGGNNNFAEIVQSGLTNNQTITVNSGGIVTLTGGGGAQNWAQISNDGHAQTINFTAGGALNLQGGTGAGGQNTANLQNNGVGATAQTISFSGGGAINVTAGSNTTNDNSAVIQAFTGNQTFNGNADITLIGGVNGGASNNGNSANITLKSGAAGIQTINAHNLSLQGGAGGIENSATISAESTGQTQIITTTGSVSVTGGGVGSTDAVAAIGTNQGATNLTINAAGNVTLTGGGGAFTNYGAIALIGAVGGFNANVTINGQAGIALHKGTGTNANALIGSDTGGGSLLLNSGLGGAGNVALNDGLINTTGTATLVAAGTGAITQSVITATIVAASGVSLTGASIGTALNPIAFDAGGNTVSATATSGGIYLKQAIGNLLTSKYTLNAAAAGQSIFLATTNGSLSVDTLGGFNANTNNDNLSLTTAGITKDIAFSGGISLTAANLTLAGTGSATFNAGTVTLNTPVTATMAVSINGATVNFNGASSVSGTLNIGGGTLTAASPLTAGILNLSSGTLNGASTLTLTGVGSTWTGGNLGAGGGSLTIAPGATMTVANTSNIIQDTFTLTNQGTVTWSGAATNIWLAQSGAVIANSGTFDIQNNLTLAYNGGAMPTIINTGTFQKSAGGSSSNVNIALNNNAGGNVKGLNGTLSFNSGGTDAGTFNATAGNAVQFNGGTHTINTGTNFTGAGAFVVASGALSLGGTATMTNLALAGGAVGGAGTLTLTGANSTWTAGTLGAGGGTLLVSPGATLTVANTSNIFLDTFTLANQGTVTWSGAATNVWLAQSGALIDNQATGVFDIQNNLTLAYNGGALPSINNAGVFQKTAGAGTSNINIDFPSNNGTFSVQSGSVQLSSNFTNNGTLDLRATGAVNTFNVAGNVTLAPSSMLDIEINSTAAGQFGNLNATNASLNGTLNLSKTAPYVPNAGDTFQVVTSTLNTGSFTSVSSTFGVTFTPTYNLMNASMLLSSLATINVWTGAVDNNWTTAGNWSLSHVPLFNEDVLLTLAPTVSISGAQAVHALTSTEALNITIGSSLDLGAASSFGANLTLSGTLQGVGAATFTAGTLNWTGGVLKGSGLFTATGGTLTLGNSLLDGRTFNNSVNATLTGGNFSLANGAIFNHNAGTFAITDNSGLAQGAGLVGQFNNAAAFSKTGGAGTSTISGIQFLNPGTVNANSGTLDIAVNGTHSGLFSVSVGNTLRFSAGATMTGGSTVSGAGTVDISSGTVNEAGVYNAATTSVTGGTLNFNSASTSIGTLNLSAGTVGGASDLTVSNDFNQTGGAFTISGNLDLSSAGNFTVGAFNNPGKSVTLRAPVGAIFDGNGAANNVTASSLTLIAANGIALDTTVPTLIATNMASGNVSLNNAGALNLVGIANSGGGTTTLVNAGNLTVAGAVTTTANGDINLTATGGVLSVASTISSGGTGAASLTTTGASKDIAFSGAGSLTGGSATLTATGAVTSGTAGTDISTNGTLTVSAGTSIGSLGNSLEVNSGAGLMNFTAGTGGIFVDQSVGNLAYSKLATVSAAGVGQAVRFSTANGSINIDGYLGFQTNTADDNIAAVANGALSDITVTASPSLLNGNVTGTAGRNIAINVANAVNTTGNVALTAGGSISDNAGAGSIHGALLTTNSVGGTTLGGANSVTTFNATNTGGGNIQFSNAGGPLTVSGITQTGGGNVTVNNAGAVTNTGTITTAANGNISVTATGADATIGAAMTASGLGTVSINAGNRILDPGAAVIAGSAITLNAVNGMGSIGAPIGVQPSGSALTATNTAANDIVLYQPAGNLTVGTGGATLSNTGAGYVIGAAGNVTINSGAPASGNMILAAGNNVVVAASGYTNTGDIALSAANNVIVNGNLSAGNNLAIAATNNVSILDAVASSAGFFNVTAATLDVTATTSFTQMRGGTTFTATISGLATLQGGSGVAAEIMNSGPGSFVVNTGALTINGGSGASGYARLFGNPDVRVTVNAGTINLNAGTGGSYAAIQAVSPTSIYVDFPNLTADGFTLNSVLNGVYDAPTNSGFIAGGLPAVLGTNLLVTYAGAPVAPPPVTVLPPVVQQQVNQVVQQTSSIIATTQNALINTPPAPADDSATQDAPAPAEGGKPSAPAPSKQKPSACR
ncbi:MAG: hypothetical protein JWN94_839 [Betaproteobacteria bacterium]|nr:hypothetical protein [Betaproteobacteria bacterium]